MLDKRARKEYNRAMNWYGFLIACAIILGFIGAYFAAKHRGIEGDIIIDMCLFCLPLAILGARIYHVVFDVAAGNSWTFAEFFGFSNGEFKGLAGLAIYGGLFGALIGAGLMHLWKNRKSLPENKRLSFWQIVDLGFIFILLGQVVGRWGNLANSEGYGGIVNNPTWQWKPFAMIGRDGKWHYAMPFYESMWDLVGAAILIYMYLGRFKSFDGFAFAGYGIWYGIGRTYLEAIRVDDVLMLGGVRISVLVSILFILAGVAIIVVHIVLAKRANKKIFIFVDKSKLDTDYYGYEKTKLYNPMPDIVFFKDRKKRATQNEQEVIVDESGVAIRVDAEAPADDADETAPTEKAKKSKAKATEPKSAMPDEEYEDKWDD